MSFLSEVKNISEILQAFHDTTLQGDVPVINQAPMQDILDDLNPVQWLNHGGLQAEELNGFVHRYLKYATRLHHPGYMGHQCAPVHPAGAVGALIDAYANTVMGIYEMGPGATTLEWVMVNWMLKHIGWLPQNLNKNSESNVTAAGVFVNGGSMANLLALIVIRKQAVPDIWNHGNPGNLALMVPDESHYSISKSAGILGIGQQAIYTVPTDQDGKVIPSKLEAVLQQLIDDGKQPLALTANACCTSVGTHDPLHKLADFCEKHQLWLHVDGAHGASALISGKYRTQLAGIERADSIIWDAHKMLKTPSLCAALLVKQKHHLETAMHHEASYLFHEKQQPGIDFIHRTIECTKSALASKLFFVLAAEGESIMAKYIEHQYQLATKAYDYINTQPDFVCAVTPESNILCFRHLSDDATQLSTRAELLMQKKFYITTVRFKGKQYLRLVFMNENSHLDDVVCLIETIRKIVGTFQ